MKKRNLFNITFIAIISFILCYSFIFDEIQFGHDGLFHISRIYGIVDALKDGQLVPRIYPTFNNNFGYGTSLFYCDLFFLPFALLYLCGLPIIICYKTMIIFYTVLSVIIAFIVSKKIIKEKSEIVPYISTILYTFSSYHILDLYLRHAMGEVLAITFIPLFVYSTYELFIEKKNSWLLLGISFSLLLFSHNLTFALYCFLFLILIIIYTLFNIKDTTEIKRLLITTLKGTIFAILLSSWFLLPMLEQMLSQSFKVNTYGMYYDLRNNMASFIKMIDPTNIVFINSKKFFDFGPGFILIVISVLYLFIKKNKYISTLFIISWFLILCETGVIPLYLVKQLGVIQFLFRFNIVIFPLLTIISSYVLLAISNKNIQTFLIILICICSLISIVSFYSYYNGGYYYYSNDAGPEIIFDQTHYLDFGYNYSELAAGDYLPAGIDIDYLAYPRHIREMTSEYSYNEIIFDYEIIAYESKMQFIHNFEDNMLIAFPKTYYKGYQAFIIDDGKWIKLETVNIPHYHLVGAYVPKGEHEIFLQYSGTKVQKVSTLISLSTLALLFIFIHRRNNEKNKTIS